MIRNMPNLWLFGKVGQIRSKPHRRGQLIFPGSTHYAFICIRISKAYIILNNNQFALMYLKLKSYIFDIPNLPSSLNLPFACLHVPPAGLLYCEWVGFAILPFWTVQLDFFSTVTIIEVEHFGALLEMIDISKNSTQCFTNLGVQFTIKTLDAEQNFEIGRKYSKHDHKNNILESSQKHFSLWQSQIFIDNCSWFVVFL